MKVFIILGAINAMIAVALGAFGAHGLEGKVSAKYLEVWKTGVQYQMFHAVGLLVIGLLTNKIVQSSMLQWSGWIMFAGIVLFSGSLYLLTLVQIKPIGIITPFGGVCFILSWLFLIIATSKNL